jgi:hypothetical protein
MVTLLVENIIRNIFRIGSPNAQQISQHRPAQYNQGAVYFSEAESEDDA